LQGTNTLAYVVLSVGEEKQKRFMTLHSVSPHSVVSLNFTANKVVKFSKNTNFKLMAVKKSDCKFAGKIFANVALSSDNKRFIAAAKVS
jgi:hypothetical protein